MKYTHAAAVELDAAAAAGAAGVLVVVYAAGVAGAAAAGFGAGAFLAFHHELNWKCTHDISLATIDNNTVPIINKYKLWYCVLFR